jgi:hypothetical protein
MVVVSWRFVVCVVVLGGSRKRGEKETEAERRGRRRRNGQE